MFSGSLIITILSSKRKIFHCYIFHMTELSSLPHCFIVIPAERIFRHSGRAEREPESICREKLFQWTKNTGQLKNPEGGYD